MGAERRQSERCPATPLTEPTPDEVEGVAHGRGRQATLGPSGGLHGAREAVARTGVGLDHWQGHHPLRSPLAQQPPHDGAIMTVGRIAPRAVLQQRLKS